MVLTLHAQARYRERSRSALRAREALELSVPWAPRRVLQVVLKPIAHRQGRTGRRLYRKRHTMRLTSEGVFICTGQRAVTFVAMSDEQLATFLVGEMTGVWL